MKQLTANTLTQRTVVAEERLWLTADRQRLVEDGHSDAAFLFCIPGQLIPYGEAARVGLVAEDTPAADAPAAVKESAPEATKESKPDRTKERKPERTK